MLLAHCDEEVVSDTAMRGSGTWWCAPVVAATAEPLGGFQAITTALTGATWDCHTQVARLVAGTEQRRRSSPARSRRLFAMRMALHSEGSYEEVLVLISERAGFG
jgi:hypothetical protein